MDRKSAFILAKNDIKNIFFELGLTHSVSDEINPSDKLRETLDLDSQEMMTLVDSVSSLAIASPPLQEDNVLTAGDLIAFLAENRDNWLFDDVPYILQSSILINSNIDTVFSYISEYQSWPDILKHVSKITPEYDDGRFQSFTMHIEELGTGNPYYVKSWRYLNPKLGIIDFSQPLPPAGFGCHKGGWRFITQGENQTRLVSYHGFSLQDAVDPEEHITLIRKHIHAALSTWACHNNGEANA